MIVIIVLVAAIIQEFYLFLSPSPNYVVLRFPVNKVTETRKAQTRYNNWRERFKELRAEQR